MSSVSAVRPDEGPTDFLIGDFCHARRITAFVVSVLLAVAAVALHLFSINAIAVYVTAGASAVLFVGAVIQSVASFKALQQEIDINIERKEEPFRQKVYELDVFQKLNNGDPAPLLQALQDPKFELHLAPLQMLNQAAFLGSLDLVQQLLQRGAVPGTFGITTTLCEALKTRHGDHLVEIIHAILDKEPRQLNESVNRLSPLRLALLTWPGGALEKSVDLQIQITQLLVDQHCDVNAAYNGATPLHFHLATQAPNMDILLILCKAGAEWHREDNSHFTPAQLLEQERLREWRDDPAKAEKLAAIRTYF